MQRGVTTDAPLTSAERQIGGSSSPPAPRQSDRAIISAAKYRQLTGDHSSTDDRIVERLAYLEQFCRAIIQREMAPMYGEEDTKRN